MSICRDILLLFLHYAILSVVHIHCVELPVCNENKLTSCGNADGIECNASIKRCQCAPGYEFHPESLDITTACILKVGLDSPRGGSNTVSVVIVTLLTLILIGAALFFIVRRYDLLHWARNNMFSRRNPGATYEDVMIGQDDPPISA